MIIRVGQAARLSAAMSTAGRVLLVACLLLSTAAGVAGAGTDTTGAEPGQGPPLSAAPYLMIENVGQYAPEARFLLRQGERRLWLTGDSLWLTVPDPVPADEVAPGRSGRERKQAPAPRGGTVLRFTFSGANTNAILEPYGRLSTRVSYLIGKDPTSWHRNVPVWSGVRYRNLYPGVDLVVGDGAGGRVPWRLETQPGADLGSVRLRVEGAESVAAEAGGLRLGMKGRAVDLALPAWSMSGGTELTASTVVQEDGGTNFTIAPDLAAHLEPATQGGAQEAAAAGDLIYNKLLGGTADDWGNGIAVDAEGNAYITGQTASNNFPDTTGGFDPDYSGGEAFVVKLNPAGDAVVYATYLGGSGYDLGWGIAVDGGLAHVVGQTDSYDFPHMTGEPIGTDIFVAALNATGDDVRYVVHIGGDGADIGYAIATEEMAVYVAGSSTSTSLLQEPACGSGTHRQLIIAKLSAVGARSYTTCMGGGVHEVGNAIAVRNGEAYVAGDSYISDPLGNRTGDILVAHFDRYGGLSASTLIGETADDGSNGIAIDASGNVYVAASTIPPETEPPTPSDFPVTAGTPPYGGGASDAVMLKLLPALTIDFATFLGGGGGDYGYGIAVDAVAGFVAAGATEGAGFPVTAGAYSVTPSGGWDAFVARMHMSSSAPNKVTYATYLGGVGDDWAYGVATDTGGHAFATGMTPSAADPEWTDAFAAKLKVSGPPDPPEVSISVYLPNVVVNWGPVQNAAKYQVFRSSAPYFQAGDSTSELLSEPTPPTASYEDAGALLPTAPQDYYYLVRAVDGTLVPGPSSNRVGKHTVELVKGAR